MIRNSRRKLPVLTNTISKSIYCRPKFHERLQLNGCGNTEVDVILMRAEIPLENKLRNCDLSIYRTTEILVALPLIGRDVVRRRGGQRDQGRLEAVSYERQRLPPFGLEVMRFIEYKSSGSRESFRQFDWYC